MARRYWCWLVVVFGIATNGSHCLISKHRLEGISSATLHMDKRTKLNCLLLPTWNYDFVKFHFHSFSSPLFSLYGNGQNGIIIIIIGNIYCRSTNSCANNRSILWKFCANFLCSRNWVACLLKAYFWACVRQLNLSFVYMCVCVQLT